MDNYLFYRATPVIRYTCLRCKGTVEILGIINDPPQFIALCLSCKKAYKIGNSVREAELNYKYKVE